MSGRINKLTRRLGAREASHRAHAFSGIPLVLPLLHGSSGFWDEIFIFGGIGVIVAGLGLLSWRSGRDRKRRRRGARRR